MKIFDFLKKKKNNFLGYLYEFWNEYCVKRYLIYYIKFLNYFQYSLWHKKKDYIKNKSYKSIGKIIYFNWKEYIINIQKYIIHYILQLEKKLYSSNIL